MKKHNKTTFMCLGHTRVRLGGGRREKGVAHITEKQDEIDKLCCSHFEQLQCVFFWCAAALFVQSSEMHLTRFVMCFFLCSKMFVPWSLDSVFSFFFFNLNKELFSLW